VGELSIKGVRSSGNHRVWNALISDTNIDELDLVQRAARRDQAALSALYDRYAPLVKAIALRIVGQPDDAEEVVLEVFCQAWRMAADFDGGRGRVDSWLMMMTRSRALDRLRRLERTRGHVALEDATPLVSVGAPNDPAHTVEASETRAAVQTAMSSLPIDQREALEMAYYSGLSHAEIASQIGEPLGTVKTRIRLGLTKMRHVLLPAWGGAS
jgi:RNA polymerase sigma-70 factor (ECF subfamily)